MANVSYKISGKSDNSAINQTQKGLQSLTQVANGVQKVFTGFLGIKAVQAIGKAVNDTLDSYKTQQKAIVQLSQAVNNNSNLAAGSLKRLVDYTGQLQNQSIFGDEALQAQATLLAGMGRTEDQIKDVLKAAVELSSAGIGTLEGNVKNLAKTYGGLTGELGESLPALKGFSKEALISGEAVKYVAREYAGFAESLANNTLEGKEKKISNLFGDIKEKIGAIAGIGKIALFDNLEPLLININNYIAEILPKVANFFINLPEIASIAFTTIINLAKTIFTIDYFVTLIKALARYIIDVLTATLQTLVSIIQAIATTIWEPLKWSFDTLALGIKNVFSTVINAIITGVESAVNFLLSGVNKLIGAINSVASFLGKDGNLITEISDLKLTLIEPPKDERSDVGKAISDSWKNVGSTFISSLKTIGQSYLTFADTVTSPLAPILEQSGKQIADILNQDLPSWIADALAPVTGQGLDTNTTSSGTGVGGSSVESVNQGYSAFGGADMSVFGLLADAISPMISQLMGMFTALSSVNQILNPITTIFTSMFTVLEPFIDEMLMPIVGILNIVGQVLAALLMPALQFLTPVIQAVAEIFVWLYNKAIMPMGNAIIKLSTSLYNGVSYIVNGLVKLINQIPGVNISWRMGYMDYESLKLNAITYSDVVAAGASTVTNSSSSSSGSSSSSYSGASTINIYISYENSYVNGDARAIALNLRDEIRSAEKLGK